MDDISELLLVKSVTGAMYDGRGETSTKGAPKGFGGSPFSAPSYAFHLKDVFTPFSDGKININTADANTLQLIPGVDEAAAEAIIKTRAGPDGVEGTEDDTPFTGAGDVQRAGIDPEAMQNISAYCDVRSHTFEVHVTAHYANASRNYVAVVWRNTPQDIRVVQFYWEPLQAGPSVTVQSPAGE